MHTLTKQPTSFLDAITGPAELKQLSVEDLQKLAGEIRHEIVSSLSRTGGHLASNLGIVEITLALHRVFNTPQDQILWDVGHQAYVHKMLTGRRNRFDTLRQFKGLSGFVTPVESEHDAFVAGHSSTSVSLAVGMAIARDHLQQDHKVIAVIGDGGLTGGMALEAINHLGHIQKNVLIVLNDNEMSISENTGGLALYMDKGQLVYEYNGMIIERAIARSAGKVAAGKHRVEVVTTLASAQPLSPADVVLKVDGQEVARTTVKRTVPGAFSASETFDVGVDLGSTVSVDYFERRPFRFDGRIGSVQVTLAKP